jgi:hypothetical protein
MPLTVYVETSVISYYTARASRDVVTAARQTLTQEWWDDAGLSILEINDAAERLARRFLEEGEYLNRVLKTRFILHLQPSTGWIFF